MEMLEVDVCELATWWLLTFGMRGVSAVEAYSAFVDRSPREPLGWWRTYWNLCDAEILDSYMDQENSWIRLTSKGLEVIKNGRV